jgi:hypothetical protein
MFRHLVAMGNTLDGRAMVKRSEMRNSEKEHVRKEEEEVVAAEKQRSGKQ